MNFIGNKKTVELLANSLKRGVINHAYLFSGPEFVGKFTLAKLFVLSAISDQQLILDADQATKNALMDLIVVEPEVTEKSGVSKQRDISIETIRDAKQSLSLYPYSGKYKVLIVRDAHRLNTAAQNALLKILEEPNQTTIIILVTHEIERILPTILSRCQTINFALADGEQMKEAGFEEGDIELSLGRPGLAIRVANNQEEKEFRMQAKKELSRLLNGSLNERFLLADEFSKDIVKALEKLNIWLWEIRKNALACSGKNQQTTYNALEKIQKTINTLKRSNASSKLILEALFMDI